MSILYGVRRKTRRVSRKWTFIIMRNELNCVFTRKYDIFTTVRFWDRFSRTGFEQSKKPLRNHWCLNHWIGPDHWSLVSSPKPLKSISRALIHSIGSTFAAPSVRNIFKATDIIRVACIAYSYLQRTNCEVFYQWTFRLQRGRATHWTRVRPVLDVCSHTDRFILPTADKTNLKEID